MGDYKTSKMLIACLKIFVSNNMLKEHVSCTNKYTDAKKTTHEREGNAKTTSEKEMKADIALLYFAGVFKSGRQDKYDLCNNVGLTLKYFSQQCHYISKIPVFATVYQIGLYCNKKFPKRI